MMDWGEFQFKQDPQNAIYPNNWINFGFIRCDFYGSLFLRFYGLLPRIGREAVKICPAV